MTTNTTVTQSYKIIRKNNNDNTHVHILAQSKLQWWKKV